jgi:DNA polymerase-3 subunit gamma/tau
MTVAKNEGLELSEDAALLIARVADGALRDALSILDQCAGYNEPITINTVSNAAGLLGKDYLFELSDAILAGDTGAVLSIIDRLHSSSCDMERLMSELVNHFRNIMMAKTTKQPEKFIVCTPDELNRYKNDGQRITNGTLLYVMETLCAESSKLKYSSHQRAQTEAVLIRLCSPELSTDNSALVRRIDELEAQLMLIKAQGVTVAPSPAPKQEKASISTPTPEPKATPVATPMAQPIEEKPTEEANTVVAEIAPAKPAEVITEAPKKTEPTPVIDTGIVTESDSAMPFAAWENTLSQLAIICRPLHPMLIGSQAFRAGNTVFIKAKNTAFPQMFKNKDNVEAITQSLMRATGENLRPALYTDGSSPAVEDGAEPIDSFIGKLEKHRIDFIVEE